MVLEKCHHHWNRGIERKKQNKNEWIIEFRMVVSVDAEAAGEKNLEEGGIVAAGWFFAHFSLHIYPVFICWVVVFR